MNNYLRLTILWIMLGYMLVACGGEDKKETPQPTNTLPATVATLAPTATVSASAIAPEIRPTMEVQYEELRQAQTAIESVWSRLQAGESVACSEALPILGSPEAYQDQALLYQAAQDVREAYNLWEGECQQERAQPPFEVIDRGLRAALSAGDNLRAVEELLGQQ
jgi:hypothetical protein